ncbi:hypothetical protein NDU88_002208 [Pleurodeles waltl]|uniref:Uncharacterized protein n=1 Tax=Pleurodeles waltl TaxID=8319 RepID=A0AAV7UAE1_PLEWA|nr:hypothetical protein NDU88_002208 [Pleurodeles waltl]
MFASFPVAEPEAVISVSLVVPSLLHGEGQQFPGLVPRPGPVHLDVVFRVVLVRANQVAVVLELGGKCLWF